MAICRKICCCDCSEDPAHAAMQKQNEEMKKYQPSNPAASGDIRTRGGSLPPPLNNNGDPLLTSGSASPMLRPVGLPSAAAASSFELQPSPSSSSVDPKSPRLGFRPGDTKRKVQFSDTPSPPPPTLKPGTPVRSIYKQQSSFNAAGIGGSQYKSFDGPMFAAALNSSLRDTSPAFGGGSTASLNSSQRDTFGSAILPAAITGASVSPSGQISNLVSPTITSHTTGGREPPDLSLL